MLFYPCRKVFEAIFIIIRCVARNILGEAAATLRLNVVSRKSFLLPKKNNNGNEMHASRDNSIFISLDDSFLKIEPDILKADVGAKAHFSCQGNALNELANNEILTNRNIRIGKYYQVTVAFKL